MIQEGVYLILFHSANRGIMVYPFKMLSPMARLSPDPRRVLNDDVGQFKLILIDFAPFDPTDFFEEVMQPDS